MAQKKTSFRVRLTEQSLQELKDKGYQYVLVKSYTPDRRLDHIHLNHIILMPVMALPTKPGDREIFAPIDSEVLLDWVSSQDASFEAYIEKE
jgi:hypothetical protein